MIKLFACDLDGTLLNARHMTDRTILKCVHEVVSAGAHLAVATGRAVQSTSDHGFRGAPVDMLGSNGTIVRDREGHLLKTFPIDPAALEDLRGLAASGVEVLTCGTCLDHYGIADTLAVGEVTNMYVIAQRLTGASLVVRP